MSKQQGKPEVPPSDARSALRTGFFANKTAKKIVTLSNGMEVEVRQPTVGMQLVLGQMEDSSKRMLRMFVEHVFVPNTDEKVFEESDYEVLREMPAGGDYTNILTSITEVMGIRTGVEEAAKN